MALSAKITATIILWLTCISAQAAEVYQFVNSKQRQTFYNIVEQSRCLVCQNETLLDSQAPLAHDLRQDIYLKVKAGQSQEQVLQYLTNRYGQFVLFKPKFELKNYLLWFGPFILLLMVILLLLTKRKHKTIMLTAAQQQQAKKLLQDES
jgi:cytochrome c-type biogenesis protein CcmH